MAPDRFTAVVRPSGIQLLPFQPQVYWVSRVQVRRGERFAPHLHAHFELIIPERGPYRCRVGGCVVEAVAGEAILVNPGDAHEDPLDGPVAYLGCSFRLIPSPDPDRSPPILAADAPGDVRRIPASPGLVELQARVRAATHVRPEPFAWAALDAGCAAWLWELVSGLPSDHRAPRLRLPETHDLAARLQEVLAQEPASAIPLAEFAAHAGMTPRAFAAACRERLGLSPLEARRRARCEAAATLLVRGMTVAEAAERLGFANPFHFSRVFARTMGRAPSSWR